MLDATRLPVVLRRSPVQPETATRDRALLEARWVGASEDALPIATLVPLAGEQYQAFTDAGECLVFPTLAAARRELWLYCLLPAEAGAFAPPEPDEV